MVLHWSVEQNMIREASMLHNHNVGKINSDIDNILLSRIPIIMISEAAVNDKCFLETAGLWLIVHRDRDEILL